MLDMTMNAPPPDSAMTGTAAFASSDTERTCRANMRSRASTLAEPGSSSAAPAFATTVSSRPQRSRAAARAIRMPLRPSRRTRHRRRRGPAPAWRAPRRPGRRREDRRPGPGRPRRRGPRPRRDRSPTSRRSRSPPAPRTRTTAMDGGGSPSRRACSPCAPPRVRCRRAYGPRLRCGIAVRDAGHHQSGRTRSRVLPHDGSVGSATEGATMASMDDRTIVVTGAASGIGARPSARSRVPARW